MEQPPVPYTSVEVIGTFGKAETAEASSLPTWEIV